MSVFKSFLKYLENNGGYLLLNLSTYDQKQILDQ